MKESGFMAICLGLLLFAGCFDAGPGDSEPTKTGSEQPSGSSTSSETGTPGPDSPSPRSANSFEGTDCVGSDSRSLALNEMLGLDPPEGWEPAATHPYSFMNHMAFRCDRLSWGDIERGPIHLLWEVHEGFSPPETCDDGSSIPLTIVTQMYDDEAVVNHAKGLGMPGLPAEFEFTIDNVQGLTNWVWRWQPEGHEASSMEFRDYPPEIVGTRIVPYRLFWFDGATVSYMDLTTTEESDQLFELPVTGTMNDPMFYARLGTPYSGTGTQFFTIDLSGNIHRFRDLKCEDPIES